MAHANLAGALLDQGERVEARRHFEAALALDPSMAAVRKQLENLDAP